jgi:hypothetical protein
MAKILYKSVHEILEYDELNLLYDLGHTVFTLGSFCPVSVGEPGWRPRPQVREDVVDLTDAFVKTGGQITKEFVNLFDVVLVMHDLEFIMLHWDILKHKKVIWRTIGQGVQEKIAKPFRNEGLYVVGWSELEALSANFIGRDAVIYSYKDPETYRPWNGREGGVLSFSNAFRQRYPYELEFFQASIEGLPCKLGGGMNEDIPNSIGLVDFPDQIRMYAECGAYFYAHGSNIPYTLNFIEAFMTGAPIVAIGPKADLLGYDLRCNEIVHLIKNGENGFLANTPAEANVALRELLASPSLAAMVSSAGRKLAIETFGKATAIKAWGTFFDSIGVT